MALSALGSHQDPGPRQAEPFGGGLMGLQLQFTGFCFAWHSNAPLSIKTSARAKRDYTIKMGGSFFLL
jgi:hypothetical protein